MDARTAVAIRFVIAFVILVAAAGACWVLISFIANLSGNLSGIGTDLDQWAATQKSTSQKWQWDVLNALVTIAVPCAVAALFGWLLGLGLTSGMLYLLGKPKIGGPLVLIGGVIISGLMLASSVYLYHSGAELRGIDSIGLEGFLSWLLGPDRGYYPRKLISNWAWYQLVPAAALLFTGLTYLAKTGGLSLDRLHRWLPK